MENQFFKITKKKRRQQQQKAKMCANQDPLKTNARRSAKHTHEKATSLQL